MTATDSSGAAPALIGIGADLLQALSEPGCPLCRVVTGAVQQYLEAISYESVNDLGFREDWRASLGYCPPHGQQWQTLRNALGTALLYRDLCGHLLTLLAESGVAAPGDATWAAQMQQRLRRKGTRAGRALARALQPHRPCPACVQHQAIEQRTLAACAEALRVPTFGAAYQAHAQGLCLPHFRALLPHVTDPADLRNLIAWQAAPLAATRADLAEVIRKFDYRFQHEPRGPEFQAVARSLEQVGGGPGLAPPVAPQPTVPNSPRPRPPG
jgi:hypothetical protein